MATPTWIAHSPKSIYEECRRYADEFVFPESTALTVAPKAELIEKYVPRGWLCTQEEITTLAAWSEKEAIREQKQNALSLYDHDTKETLKQKAQLRSLIRSHKDELFEILMSGEIVYAYFVDVAPTPTFGAGNSTLPIQMLSARRCDDNSYPNMLVNDRPSDIEWTRDSVYVECGIKETVNRTVMHISSYKQLVALLAIDRSEIPFIFRNYNSYAFQPYYGNSILDNVNPEFLVRDKMSREHKNSYSIGLTLDKRCFNRLVKQHHRFKHSLVLLSYTHRCVVDIVDYDEFIRVNDHLNHSTQCYI